MNSLSWLLYLAEVIPNVGSAALLYAILAGVFGSAALFFITIEFEVTTKKFVKWHIAALVLALVLVMITPSKETIYLIAGSQVGSAIVESEDGQEIINKMRLIIKGQISDMVPRDLGGE